MSRLSFEVIEALTRDVQDANPLPTTLAELSPSGREAVEAQAVRQRLTPEALLALVRHERTKERELREAADSVTAAVRAARS